MREALNGKEGKRFLDLHSVGLGPPKAPLDEGALGGGIWNIQVLKIETKRSSGKRGRESGWVSCRSGEL